MQRYLLTLSTAWSILPFLSLATLNLWKLVFAFVGPCSGQSLLDFLLLSLMRLFLLQPLFHFPCHFLPLNFPRPHSTLNSYTVTLVRDPLTYYQWVPHTFITCKLSSRQVLGSWHIVVYHLTLKWAVLSFSSSASAALSSQALGRPGHPPIWGHNALQFGHQTFTKWHPFIIEHGFYKVGLCLLKWR